MSHQPSLPGTGLRVAFVTMHTSPLERAGTADAGGMNVLIAAPTPTSRNERTWPRR